VIAAITILVVIYDLCVLGGADARINRLTDETNGLEELGFPKARGLIPH
jgi:hypothetical protein